MTWKAGEWGGDWVTVDGAESCPCPQLHSCSVVALFLGSLTRLNFLVGV